MTVYSYPQSDIIDEVTFEKSARGGIRAYVHAAAGADPKVLHDITCTLQDKGFQCIPIMHKGRPALELRDFKREEEVIACFVQGGWVKGNSVEHSLPEDRIGFMDKLRKRSLQASGLAFIAADIGFTKYGAKEKCLEDTLAGISYMLGSVELSAFGRNDQADLQVRQIAQGMLQHAKQKGLNIPDDCVVNSIGAGQSKGVIRKTYNFLRENPAEIGNMMYFTAGALIASAALRRKVFNTPRATMDANQIFKMRMSGAGDTLLGMSTMASGLIGAFVKEKAHDPDAPKQTGAARLWEYIQEKPLAVAGLGYMVSTACHAFTTYSERKEALNVLKTSAGRATQEIMLAKEKMGAIPWRMLFIGATLVGEVLLTISSKGHGEGVKSDKSVDKSIIALSADLIARQPVAMQEQLVSYMAQFLGRPDVLALSNDKVRKQLTESVNSSRQNPWVMASSLRTSPALPSTSSIPAWQAKVALSETKPAQPGLSA